MATKKQNENEKEEVVEAEVVKETKAYTRPDEGRLFFGLLFILVGGMLIAQNLLNIDLWHNFWPIIIILLGLTLIMRSIRD